MEKIEKSKIIPPEYCHICRYKGQFDKVKDTPTILGWKCPKCGFYVSVTLKFPVWPKKKSKEVE